MSNVQSSIAASKIVNLLQEMIMVLLASNGVRSEFSPTSPKDFMILGEGVDERDSSETDQPTREQLQQQWRAMKARLKKMATKKSRPDSS